MKETILIGRGQQFVELPRKMWEGHLEQAPGIMRNRLDFMTEAHHQVRYYVVREMPRFGRAIRPEQIAADLKLPLPQVVSLLDDLEKNLLFLYRDDQGAVDWAYPVTIEKTPHTITFSSGERLHGA